MRGSLWLMLLIVPAMAGCLDANSLFTDGSLRNCKDPQTFTLYLGPDLGLQREMPATGETPGNGFNEAFLSNDLDEWHGPFAERTWRVQGDIVLDFWTRANDQAAPIIIGGEAGEGYHFFNQIGSNRGFIESYAVEYASALPDQQVRHFTETFAAPDGGMLLEQGDYLRLLLTNLVLDDPETGEGPAILWGEDTPSRVTYQATCELNPTWRTGDVGETSIVIPAHQGLLTGLVPAEEGINYQNVTFNLAPDTGRLTIRLVATDDREPKNDMDLTVYDSEGNPNWGIGSPYTDEIGTRWTANLQASMPPGQYTISVNSYSGHAYLGTLEITQEVRA